MQRYLSYTGRCQGRRRSYGYHLAPRAKRRFLHQEDSQSKSFLAGLSEKNDTVHHFYSSIVERYEKLHDSVLQQWKLPEIAAAIPPFLGRMKDSFEFKSGSMGAGVIEDMKTFEYAGQKARVRLGADLCQHEKDFAMERAHFCKEALARYLDIDVSDIDQEDVPLIGVAASGGGLRACLNTTAYYELMKEEGILDLTTYLAGVSGSTWAQALLHTSSIAQNDPSRALRHFSNKVSTHIADPSSNLDVLRDKITGKYVLRGLLERFHAGYKDLGLTDLYGLLLANRYFIPENSEKIMDKDLLISGQARSLDKGENPMPIYSCVRHEIPKEAREAVQTQAISKQQEEEIVANKSYFQFYEFSPFEFGSEETKAWIPTWSVGRTFSNGESVNNRPEVRLTTLLGTFSSAFCASLSAYLAEIEPLITTDNPIYRHFKASIAAHDEKLKTIQLIDATKLPNYAIGVNLGKGVPSHMSTIKDLELCDAGMANNLPFYPLLRRNCDIVIALDSSADIETTPWFSRTEGYAKQRNIKSWPEGIVWPQSEVHEGSQMSSEASMSPQEAAARLDKSKQKRYELEGVNVWVGQSTTRSSSASKDIKDNKRIAAEIVTADWEVVSKSSGLMLIYLPQLPHPDVADVDPATSEHLSTWNFLYTAEQVQGIQRLARANFNKERIKKAIHAMYLRKKQTRLQRPDVT